MCHFPLQDWTELTSAAPSLHANNHHSVFYCCVLGIPKPMCSETVCETGVCHRQTLRVCTLFEFSMTVPDVSVCFSLCAWYPHAKALKLSPLSDLFSQERAPVSYSVKRDTAQVRAAFVSAWWVLLFSSPFRRPVIVIIVWQRTIGMTAASEEKYILPCSLLKQTSNDGNHLQ